jgi:hypothetical protein
MLEERYHPSFLTDYSTISRRVNKLDVKIDKRIGNDDIVIALDSSTGIKVANRGEWIRDKWHVRRGYLKIHVVAVDIRKKKEGCFTRGYQRRST